MDLLDSVIDSFIHAYYNYQLTVIIQLKSISHIRRERKQSIVHVCLFRLGNYYPISNISNICGLSTFISLGDLSRFYGHASFWTRKIVRVYGRQGKLVHSSNYANIVVKENLSSRSHEQKKLIQEKLRGKKLACQVKLKSCVPGFKFHINKQLKYQILQSIHLSFF